MLCVTVVIYCFSQHTTELDSSTDGVTNTNHRKKKKKKKATRQNSLTTTNVDSKGGDGFVSELRHSFHGLPQVKQSSSTGRVTKLDHL